MESTLYPPDEPGFALIETFGFHPGEGFRRLDRHLARMARSSRAFGIAFDEAAARGALEGVSGVAQRCRLTLDRVGRFGLSTAPLGPPPQGWVLGIAEARLDPDDRFLRHKTTRRALYDQARAELPEFGDLCALRWIGAGSLTIAFDGDAAELTRTIAAGGPTPCPSGAQATAAAATLTGTLTLVTGVTCLLTAECGVFATPTAIPSPSTASPRQPTAPWRTMATAP